MVQRTNFMPKSLKVVLGNHQDVPSHQREDDICNVCLDIRYKPVKLVPCSHILCEPCTRKIVKVSSSEHKKPKCPCCREYILECKAESEMSVMLLMRYPIETEARRKEEDLAPLTFPLPQKLPTINLRISVIEQILDQIRERMTHLVIATIGISLLFTITANVFLLVLKLISLLIYPSIDGRWNVAGDIFHELGLKGSLLWSFAIMATLMNTELYSEFITEINQPRQ